MKDLRKIVFLGAGNLATQLALALFRKNFNITQVYSRTEESARLLAEKINTNFTTSLAEIKTDADLYICAVKDDAIPSVINSLKGVNGIVVHTAGSVDINIFDGKIQNYGVFYPLQTFSKYRDVDFQKIPIFLEANNSDNLFALKTLAISLSNNLYEATSNQRKILHLSAVFSSNFVNHMYALSEEIIEESGFEFQVLLPLIDEVAAKVHYLKPQEAQTGPAVRYDKIIIDKQLNMLSETERNQKIYQILSESIHEMTTKKH